MKLVEMLASLGACRDGLDWLRGHENLPDSVIWLAVEDPTWLMFVLELANSVDATTLYQVTKPLLDTWRQGKLDAFYDYDARDGSGLVGGDWRDISVLEHETDSDTRATYASALRLAGQKCCAMIRHTVAMPTRRQLADALAARSEPEFVKF